MSNETHSACDARLTVEGGKTQCCYCVPHEGCELTLPRPPASRKGGIVSKHYICNNCGYSESNRSDWCALGCGRDYNEMILADAIPANPPTPAESSTDKPLEAVIDSTLRGNIPPFDGYSNVKPYTGSDAERKKMVDAIKAAFTSILPEYREDTCCSSSDCDDHMEAAGFNAAIDAVIRRTE
jgi:hypothetical protein